MKYFDELKRSMEFLAADPRVVFMGQAVAVPGTAMSNTLKDVAPGRLIELPVAEEMQMGMTTGLALAGQVPVSIFPRWNFLMCGLSQLVNHLDKLAVMSNGGYRAKAIVRTGIGSERPLHPQHQHVGDYTEALARLEKAQGKVVPIIGPRLLVRAQVGGLAGGLARLREPRPEPQDAA